MFIMTVAINTGTSSLHIKHRESGGREGAIIGQAPSRPLSLRQLSHLKNRTTASLYMDGWMD